VIAIQPGAGIYISDGTLTIEAQNPTPCGATSGALVDVVGFPGALEGHQALENSICRKVGEGPTDSAGESYPGQILPELRMEDASGYGYSTDS
jgi:hypothetical protein